MADRVKGITVEIGGDTTKLSSALKGVNSSIKSTQTQLKDVNKLLKLDPKNTELLSQKQKLLSSEIEDTKKKLDALKQASVQVNEQLANGEISTEQYDALQREIVETESNLKSLEKELGNTKKSFSSVMADAGAKVIQLGDKVSSAGTKITKGVTVPLIGVGTAAVKSFKEVDSGYDTIVKKTGATGKQLDSLKKSADNVFGSMPTDMDSVGVAVGEVNTRFGVTGKKLEAMSASFIKFAEINDSDLNTSIGTTNKIMEQWGVKTKNTNQLLGLLTSKAQETGISVDTLMSSVQKNGATFKNMGLNLTQSINLLAKFEQNGVNADIAVAGLRKASVNFAKDGKSMDAGLKETMKSIKGAKTETEALSIASEIFGTKGAAEMTAAIREGRISLDDLKGSMKQYGDTVDNTYSGTKDGIDNFKTAMNNVKLAMGSLGSAISEVLGPMLSSLSEKIKGLTGWFKGLSPETQKMIVKIGMIVAAIGPVLVIIGKVISTVGTVITVVSKIPQVITAVRTAFAFLNTTMLANPIFLIIAAVTALVAAFIYLWNNCDDFREFWINLWNKIKEIAVNVWNAIKTTFETVWNAISNAFTTIWTVISTTISTVWNGIKSFFSGIWNGIKFIFTTVINVIYTFIKTKFLLYKTIITTVLNAIRTVITTVWNAIKTAVTTVINAIKTVISTVWKGIKTTITTVVNAIKTVITTVWNGIKTTITTVVNGIKTTISTVWNTIKTTISTVINTIKTTVGNVFSNIWTGIKNTMGNIFTSIKGGFEKAVTYITGLPKKALQWGKDIIDGIVKGIKSCIGKVKAAVEGVADKIKSFLHFSVPDEGPLTDYESWMPDFMTGLADGINKSKKVVTGAVSKLASDMSLGDVSVNRSVMTGKNTQNTELFTMAEMIINGISEKIAGHGHPIYMNKGVLVGELAGGIDRTLGREWFKAERGMK